MIAGVLAFLSGLWRPVWGFLKLLVTLPLGVILVCLALLFASGEWKARDRYKAGVKAGRAAYAAEIKAAVDRLAAENRRRDAQAASIADDVRDDHNQARGRIAGRYGALRERIPDYVPPAAARACVLPNGFVRLFNEAAAGPDRRAEAVSAGPRGPVDAPSGHDLADLSGVLLGDFEVAYGWRAEASAWRDWYVRERDAWNAP